MYRVSSALSSMVSRKRVQKVCLLSANCFLQEYLPPDSFSYLSNKELVPLYWSLARAFFEKYPSRRRVYSWQIVHLSLSQSLSLIGFLEAKRNVRNRTFLLLRHKKEVLILKKKSIKANSRTRCETKELKSFLCFRYCELVLPNHVLYTLP